MSSDRSNVDYPFRLGSTSYVFPADILPNVQKLAPIVDDIELVLFELDDGASNLPDAELCARLRAIAEAHDLTYTVHLPLDLRLAAADEAKNVSLDKARRVIESVRSLEPHAYIAHLDGTKLAGVEEEAQRWCDQAVRSLDIVAGYTGDVGRIAVENLEQYAPRWLATVLDRTSASFCVDIGHFWVVGEDPMPFLDAQLARTRVVHLHGLKERDHKSLAHTKPDALDRVVHHLVGHGYEGVLTLEVFSQQDFFSSREALFASLRRMG